MATHTAASIKCPCVRLGISLQQISADNCQLSEAPYHLHSYVFNSLLTALATLVHINLLLCYLTMPFEQGAL